MVVPPQQIENVGSQRMTCQDSPTNLQIDGVLPVDDSTLLVSFPFNNLI